MFLGKSYILPSRIGVVCMTIIIACDQRVNGTVLNAMFYLSKYGYLPFHINGSESARLVSRDIFVKSLSEFQSMMGLKVTGDLDSETLKLMATPRCGVPDKVYGKNERKRRYALQGSKWEIETITYDIKKYTKANLTKEQINNEIELGFDVWSEVTNLEFKRMPGQTVDIDILWAEKGHECMEAFDGAGGVLAHAFYPRSGGDTHFDDEENWTINSEEGKNVHQVAAHEFGHALGLSHSADKDSLMAPYYRGFQVDFKLLEDDIAGIQTIYGNRTKPRSSTRRPTSKSTSSSETSPLTPIQTTTVSEPVPTTTVPETVPTKTLQVPISKTKTPVTKNTPPMPTGPTVHGTPSSWLCRSTYIMDAIFTDSKNDTYLFSAFNYWKVTEEGIPHEYPKFITQNWRGLKPYINAAFSHKGFDYFFQGNQCWRYNGTVLSPGYPKLLNQEFPGIPPYVDAALVWKRNIFFFKDLYFWKLEARTKIIKSKFPKKILRWKGIPNNLTAAIKYSNGFTYFFKKDKYWRLKFNKKRVRHYKNNVAQDTPQFPRSTKEWWLFCGYEHNRPPGRL